MKVFALILSIFALVASTMALKDDVCDLEHSVAGFCYGNIPSWSYDKRDDKCVRFTYGGCGGNGNRFETYEECRKLCIGQ